MTEPVYPFLCPRVHGGLWYNPVKLFAFEAIFVGNWKNSRDICKDIHICVMMNVRRIEGCKFLRRNPSMLLALLTVRSMWLFHAKLLDSPTPRYFAVLTASSSCPFRL